MSDCPSLMHGIAILYVQRKVECRVLVVIDLIKVVKTGIGIFTTINSATDVDVKDPRSFNSTCYIKFLMKSR